MSFHEVTFPRAIASGARGGPFRPDEIVRLASGFEERNSPWADSLRKYDAGVGIRNLDDLHALIAFFEARRGRLYGFRWWDPADFRSCPPLQTPAATDQVLGLGDGVTTTFNLIKTYEPAGPLPWVRRIRKPVAGTVRAALNGVPKAIGTDFTANTVAGSITWATAPAAGVTVSAGFEFDVPVRFETQSLEVAVRDFQNGMIPTVPVWEIRTP